MITSDIDYETYYNTVYALDPAELQPFRYDVFKVREDDDMKALEESVRENGIITPIFVFWNEYGKMEIISGHRRIYVAKKLEFSTVPVIIKSVDYDQAVIMMADSNLKVRTTLLPTEKAKAYKMKLEALNHQGKKAAETSGPVDQKMEQERYSRDLVAESVGESGSQIRRLIRLNELEPELANLVDEKRMGLRPAVEISYLPKEIQTDIYDYYIQNRVTPSHAQTREFRKLQSEDKLDKDKVISILEKAKPNQKDEVEKMIITSPDILNYLRRYTSKMEKEYRIIKALKLLDELEKRNTERGDGEN
ncbi:MAG: ParB/RepB/Spo0J family partition protein [Eubacterium sp.]|nr:ParB/RepB/Spo0J family partition protein [Eubacterium sp.]